MGRPNIDMFGRHYFRTVLSRFEPRATLANFYIFVPSLGLPKTTAKVGSSSSTADIKLSDVSASDH